MSMEYRTEDVINVLESEEPIEKLSDSIDLMQNLIYYSIDENSGGLSSNTLTCSNTVAGMPFKLTTEVSTEPFL